MPCLLTLPLSKKRTNGAKWLKHVKLFPLRVWSILGVAQAAVMVFKLVSSMFHNLFMVRVPS